jgi:hypothetical protein
MENSYRRLRDWTDRTNLGTDTIVTSGNNGSLTGEAILTQDYTTHCYQAVQVGAGPHDGAFQIEVSNDNVNWTLIAEYPMNSTGIAYSDSWIFSHARPIITGTQGDFVINERHLQ